MLVCAKIAALIMLKLFHIRVVDLKSDFTACIIRHDANIIIRPENQFEKRNFSFLSSKWILNHEKNNVLKMKYTLKCRNLVK